MKPCARCATTFYCQPCHEPGGSSYEKRYCSKACYVAHKREPEYIVARFWGAVVKTDGCWNYMKSVKPDGYRFFRSGDRKSWRQWYAHRYSWILANGEIPAGLQVAHRCDNRACVRPDHLFLATHQENIADMKAKGRGRNRNSKDRVIFQPPPQSSP